MSVIAYTDQTERVVLSPQTRRGKMAQYHLLLPANNRRQPNRVVAYRSVKGGASKARVVYMGTTLTAGRKNTQSLLKKSNTFWDASVCTVSGFNPSKGASRPVPSLKAAANTMRFIGAMRKHGLPPTRIAVSAVGGYGVTRRAGSRKVFVEFFNDGRAHALFADDETHEMHTSPIATTEQGYKSILELVRRYLNG